MGVNKTVVTKRLEDSGFTKWAVCRNGYNTEDQYIDGMVLTSGLTGSLVTSVLRG